MYSSERFYMAPLVHYIAHAAADGAQLVVCDEGTDYRFTCCMMCTPGYAAAGKLSVITRGEA